MPFTRNCTAACAAVLLSLVAADVRAQTPQPEPGDAEFTIFLGGQPIGREVVSLARSGSDWIITANGRSGAPINHVLQRFELKYTGDWQPVELKIEATVNNNAVALATSFGGTNAINEITQNTITNSKTDQVSPRTIVLPNNIFAGYEALAARIAGAKAGLELPVYVVPQGEVKVTVKNVHEEQVATPGATLATRRYEVVINNPGGQLSAMITIDHRSRLVRLAIPVAGLTVARADVSGVAARTQIVRNPTDVDVTIPANGFSLAGTLTTPPAAASRFRYPAVVLVAGSGAVDRDETVAGIPIFAQLAGALAQRGFIVLRYDKRGVGQSGGRTESATLQDYADDVVSAVKWVEKRKDVDKKRIAVVGHSEGGAVGLIAAGREKKIANLILVATPGTTGAELILEQQAHALDLLKTPDAERQAKVELQKKIQNAVVTGEGWDGVPEELRKQADTPWFRSLLLFDPAKLMTRVKQPILIVQPALDKQVPPHHGDRLGELARARKKSPAVEVKHLPGLNHLLVPARTGEVSEYAGLPEKTTGAAVAETIAAWLGK